MSGSGGSTQGGLRLIVPAVTPAVPAIILICALLSLPVPEPMVPEATVETTVDAEVATATDIPAIEQAALAPIAAVSETPV